VKRNRYGRLAAVVATGVLALAACGNDPVVSNADNDTDRPTSGATSDLTGELAAGGASSQEAAMQAWIAGFGEAHPDVTVSYDPIGSGGGRTQFLQGAYPFAGSDAVLDEEEKRQSVQRCGGSPAIHLPIYLSPIAIVYNLEGVDDLQLSPSTIAKIFHRRITTWNDPAIAAENPGVRLPDLPISPVSRSDESGTTENFTEYLSAAAPRDWPHEPSGDWPVQGTQSAQGTSGVIQTVRGGQGTIGYADASQAGDLGTVKVKVGDEYVAHSAEAAAKVVDASPRVEDAVGHDLAIELDRTTTAPGAYPLVLVSYVIACPSYDDAAQGRLVKEFLGYIASEEGQRRAAEAAGSAPLSLEMTRRVQAAIEAIRVGSS
jgi:phosphate transport system substrate-binding protein